MEVAENALKMIVDKLSEDFPDYTFIFYNKRTINEQRIEPIEVSLDGSK